MPEQYRVVHEKDEVCQLQAPGYKHTAYEVWETGNGFLRQCDSTGEDPSCSLVIGVVSEYIWDPDHYWYLGEEFTSDVCDLSSV
jgi:hypothetical protein